MLTDADPFPLRLRPFLSLALFALAFSTIACGGAPSRDDGASSTGAAEAAAGERIAATVDGEAITRAELEEAVETIIKESQGEYENQTFEIRKAALEMLIGERLIVSQASKEGMAPELYLQREVEARTAPPGEEVIRQIYELSAAELGEQTPPFEQVRESIRQALVEQLELEARMALVASLRERAEVTVSMPALLPDAVPVPTDGPSRGEADAPVTIVEFSDYQCPFCGRAQATVERIMKEYSGKVRLVFRDYPLSFHRFAAKAAEAAHCAGDQDRFWQMHEMLYDNSDALREMDLKAYAVELGLDAERFNACLDSSEKAPVVKASLDLTEKLGLTGAPSFFINGRQLTGALPFALFKEIIDDELRRVDR